MVEDNCPYVLENNDCRAIVDGEYHGTRERGQSCDSCLYTECVVYVTIEASRDAARNRLNERIAE